MPKTKQTKKQSSRVQYNRELGKELFAAGDACGRIAGAIQLYGDRFTSQLQEAIYDGNAGKALFKLKQQKQPWSKALAHLSHLVFRVEDAITTLEEYAEDMAERCADTPEYFDVPKGTRSEREVRRDIEDVWACTRHDVERCTMCSAKPRKGLRKSGGRKGGR